MDPCFLVSTRSKLYGIEATFLVHWESPPGFGCSGGYWN
jgi:hypothetical protein